MFLSIVYDFGLAVEDFLSILCSQHHVLEEYLCYEAQQTVSQLFLLTGREAYGGI